MAHSTQLGPQMATRSPGSMPEAMKARAERSTSAASSTNDNETSPSTKASASPNRSAARVTTAPMVWGRSSLTGRDRRA